MGVKADHCGDDIYDGSYGFSSIKNETPKINNIFYEKVCFQPLKSHKTYRSIVLKSTFNPCLIHKRTQRYHPLLSVT